MPKKSQRKEVQFRDIYGIMPNMKSLFGTFSMSASEFRSSTNREIIERFSVGFFFFLSSAYILAVLGYFSRETLLILLGITVTGTVLSLRYFRPSRVSIAVGIAIILFSASVSFLASPTVFSGRDEGSYSGAALRLAHDHSLLSGIPSISHEFARLYGEGKALNVPGFFYTDEGMLSTQFPLGYIVWLGAFVSIFGLIGIVIANVVTLALTLGILFLLLWKFLPISFALFGTILAGFSFPFLWISGRTLSENLAAPLFLLLVIHFIFFIKQPSKISWAIIVLASTFLFLTRIEGFLILPITIVAIFFFAPARSFFRDRIFSVVLPAIFLVGAGIIVGISSNLPFYRSIGKALFESSSSNTASVGIPILSAIFRNLEIFWTYGMISIFAMAVLGVIFLLSNRQWFTLLPFWLALPTLVYIVSPHISPDHPWLLRRFSFSIWPIAIFLAMVALAHLQKKLSEKYSGSDFVHSFRFFLILFFLLIIPAIPAISSIFGSSENNDLLADTKKISEYFSDRDVVFVDRLASGDPYSMIADPMSTIFYKNALYVFNPEDIARFDRSRFERIFLIVRSGDELFYKDALDSRFHFEEVNPFTLRTSILSRETDPLRLPRQQNYVATGTIFLLVPFFEQSSKLSL